MKSFIELLGKAIQSTPKTLRLCGLLLFTAVTVHICRLH